MPTVAETVAAALSPLAAGALPVRVRGWDSSEAGPPGGPVVVLRRPEALRRLLFSPGELGLARAYVAGDLDVDGDLAEALRTVWAAIRGARTSRRIRPRDVARAAAAARRLGVFGRPPAPPEAEIRLRGRLHDPRRDREAIARHYDLSNDLYRMLLDESMAYSCGYWTCDDPGFGVADAQRAKLDLICAKLGLAPGARLLDVGCGWGALSIHAAREYGARIVGVTLSANQLAYAQSRVDELGLSDRVELRLQDYRDLPRDGSFDAVAAVEMGEHVGAGNYPTFLGVLIGALREQGRLCIQQMSHGPNAPGGGAFIESYVAPDMHMRPVGETVSLIENAGFEVRDVHAMREHYVRTVAAWQQVLERRWDDIVDLVGEQRARVWRLYLAGGSLAFEQGRMGVDQILAVKPTPVGASGMPSVRVAPDARLGYADAPGERAAVS
jgi:cyclopropane-fatty-acyl-phospholipid synthase